MSVLAIKRLSHSIEAGKRLDAIVGTAYTTWTPCDISRDELVSDGLLCVKYCCRWAAAVRAKRSASDNGEEKAASFNGSHISSPKQPPSRSLTHFFLSRPHLRTS